MNENMDNFGARYSTEEEAWYVTHNENKISEAVFPSEEAAIEGFKKMDYVEARYSTEEEAWYVTRNGNKISKAVFPSEEAAIEGFKQYVMVMEKNFPREVQIAKAEGKMLKDEPE